MLSQKERSAETVYGYVYMASMLEHHPNKKMYDVMEQCTLSRWWSIAPQVRYDLSVHVPSEIALVMHDYVPDYDYEPLEIATSKYTVSTPYSDSITSTELRQDLVHLISPIVELKDKLDSG